MAYCSYCGREISDQAIACPNCGHPNEARRIIPEVAFTKPPLGLAPAGFWRRFLGLLIDGIIIALVTHPLARTVEIGPNHVPIGYNPAAGPAQFLYAWLMIGLVNGQTLGAMLVGVRVLRTNGERVDLGRSAARAAMAIVSGLAVGLGYLWAAWDPEKRTWHDMVADTRVYRTKLR
jgi:uncharacterized RDD family membrane protein YckC